MAASIIEMYAPLLGHRWNSLPKEFVRRVYLDVDDQGSFTTPTGHYGRARLNQDGVQDFFNRQGQTVCQWWMSSEEMVVVDPFSKRLYVVPTYRDLHCNTKEIVEQNLGADYDLSLIDLGGLWVDEETGEVGLNGGDTSLNAPRMVRRITGAVLLGLKEDEAGDLVVDRHSYLTKYTRFINGLTTTMPLSKTNGWPSLLTKGGNLSSFGLAMAKWAKNMSPEAKEVLCGQAHASSM